MKKNKKFSLTVLIKTVLAVIVGFFLVFWIIQQNSKIKVISTQKIAENVTLQKSLSLEKTKDNQYQPTLKLKLTKPKNQKLDKKITIIERIPKEFAQNIDQLTINIPPTLILEKDPLVVWKFDEVPSEESVNVTYKLDPQDLEAILREQQIPEEEKTEIEQQTKQYLDTKPQADKSILASLVDWILGKVEEFNIVMQRDPLGLTEAEKVYTETSVMLAGKAPPAEQTKGGKLTEKAKVVDDKRVYLGDKVLLDIKDYEPACQGIGEILYAPTNDYFLVILGCFEADNEIILFKADGSDKKQITDPRGWDVVTNYEAEWEKDGKSFIYHRINSFATDPTTFARMGVKNPPKEGMIRYELATGEKTWIGPYHPPTTPTPTV